MITAEQLIDQYEQWALQDKEAKLFSDIDATLLGTHIDLLALYLERADYREPFVIETPSGDIAIQLGENQFTFEAD